MKAILSFFSSIRLMAILLVIFIISIATATFIENDFGTDVARSIVYNAKWFEILFFLGALNIVAVILKKKMYSRSKFTLFIFHCSFVVIILGAGFTRYFGHDGMMHIRVGETSNKWYSSEAHIGLSLQNQNIAFLKNYPAVFSSFSNNKMKRSVRFSDHNIKFEILEFFIHAKKYIRYSRNGEPLMHFTTSSSGEREEVILSPGQIYNTGGMIFSFQEQKTEIKNNRNIHFFMKNDSLYFHSQVEVIRTSMIDHTSEIILAGASHPFVSSALYYFDSIPVVLQQFMPSGQIDVQGSSNKNSKEASALKIKITCDDDSESILVFGRKEEPGQLFSVSIHSVTIGISYGSMLRKLPFTLRLNDFILKRYPGSHSPSWFESKVQLFDEKNNSEQEHRIYMNHVLKHRGYRFYQSSYDTDEKGTSLSVNRDGIGTAITYLGYILLALGMLLSLVNKNGRFAALAGFDKKSNRIVKFLLIGILIATSRGIYAQSAGRISDTLPVINRELARDFCNVLVQDNGGRIEPLNTLASEVLRKVTRKEQYNGQHPDQVLLGMWVYPDIWQREKMIKVSHPEMQRLLGLNSSYAAFIDFFEHDQYGGYIFKDQVENAYRKKPVYRSKFDNELIRVDERLNICYLLYTGTVFKIFPDPDDSTFQWHSPFTSSAVFNGKDSVFAQHILSFFSEEVRASGKSGNFDLPYAMIKAIRTFQSNYGKEIIPSETRIRAEVFYNNSNLFNFITRLYLLFGLILLLIQFVYFFIPHFSLRWFSIPAIGFIILFFIAHSFTLALRWYIAGHAPWSNGFEALTFIAWATVLAGLIFSRKSAITISSTAILSALILQTAHLSWMDPQITNLVPVLQSYWLVIHVAVITASYGFLGLGALLAVINLLLMIFHSSGNYERFNKQIIQLTAIIEMTLIAGLYLLTIGTFLGAVWANESWGRYWAWDPKETWALVTVIVYALVLHLRLVPGLKGRVLFTILALISFGSVIMTYFGVNYYLSGLHSYAQGDPLPVPSVVFYCLAAVILILVLAAYNQFRIRKKRT